MKVRVVREETNSYGDMVGELLGYGRNLCMGYLNKVSFRFTVSLNIYREWHICVIVLLKVPFTDRVVLV